jgi:hypothetical protein
MAVLFRETVLARVLNGTTDAYYSDPQYDLMLAEAEAYYIEVRATNITTSTAKIEVSLEISNDGVTWFVRKASFINKVAIGTTPIQVANLLVATGDSGAVKVGGCYARFSCLMSTAADLFIELIVEGRDGA